MPLQYLKNEYAIPRGRVFFDPYDANGLLTGEIYLGNCPGVTITIDTEKAEHFSSEKGLREKDAGLIVQVNRTGTLTCDNFNSTNRGLFLSGEVTTHSQASGTVTDEVQAVTPGRYYQLGATESNPAGVRNVSAVVVTDSTAATTYVAGTDYNVDLALGRIQIIKGGAIVAGNIKVDYTRAAATWDRVASGATAEKTGAVRVIADNASGANIDYYLPKVTLTPSGDLPIIADGTDFVQMEFGIEVLKPANAEAIYCDGRPVVV